MIREGINFHNLVDFSNEVEGLLQPDAREWKERCSYEGADGLDLED